MTDFLSRWSQRKHAAKRGEPEPAPASPPPAPAAAAAVPAEQEPAAPAPLPPVASLTPESDFTGFMKPDVDPLLRRDALKTLFADPRFNVMDGLDVYIDDYSKPDPLPEGWLEKMNQVARLGEYREPEPVDPDEEAARQALASPPQPSDAPLDAPVSTPATGDTETGESAGKNDA